MDIVVLAISFTNWLFDFSLDVKQMRVLLSLWSTICFCTEKFSLLIISPLWFPKLKSIISECPYNFFPPEKTNQLLYSKYRRMSLCQETDIVSCLHLFWFWLFFIFCLSYHNAFTQASRLFCKYFFYWLCLYLLESQQLQDSCSYLHSFHLPEYKNSSGILYALFLTDQGPLAVTLMPSKLLYCPSIKIKSNNSMLYYILWLCEHGASKKLNPSIQGSYPDLKHFLPFILKSYISQ